MTTYATIRHPTSGDTYAIEIDGLGEIVRASGPLHHEDPVDAVSLRDHIDHQGWQAEDDGTWLREELAAARPR